jgi:acyl transferase domain-containing protein
MNQSGQEIISTYTGLEIAVIGMSGRFPGAKNIEEFWNNLKNGVECISFFSTAELKESGVTQEELENPNYVKAHGILEEVNDFDAFFFGYTPDEARVMDPQARVFHECIWEALESAGYAPGSYGGLIGLYAGAAPHFRWEALIYLSGKNREIGPFTALNLMNKDFMTTRISYNLNLRGPSFSVQTACSTSLVAIHLACQGLLSGECHIALAGGVSVTHLYKSGYHYREGMIDSPEGHCKAFDASANGIVAGDGAGVVLLKPLEEAAADGDFILSVIKGSALNNDGGGKVGYSAPSVQGQVEVIEAALRAADVEPESITYIETHGTGTALGDPIEVKALTRAFNTGKKQFCPLGSVKTNIGHLNSAAGVAGFIKTTLALMFHCIPPSLNYQTPNPKIDFENSPFFVNRELTPWTPGKYPLRAGVSSFGIGGTNAHVILEEAPGTSGSVGMLSEGTRGLAPLSNRQYQLILLSAKTETALEKMTQNLAAYFRDNPGIPLADAAYTLQVGRDLFKHRKMLVCSTVEEAVRELSFAASPRVNTFLAKQDCHSVVFMFSGQGSQYVNMGWDLYQKEPVFRQEIDRCFEILTDLLDYNLKEILYPGISAGKQSSSPADNSRSSNGSNRSDKSYKSHESHITQTEIAQPLLFSFEYALARLLIQWGIEPYSMMGHSIGEYVAACLAGVFSLEDALKLVTRRGKLMQQMPPGAMLSISLSEEELGPLVKSNPLLSLAAVNSSSLCVVSGSTTDIEDFEKHLKEKDIKTTRLHTSHAFHSNMMDPILTEFEAEVKKVKLHVPAAPYISNVTGKWISESEATDPRYWADHIRQTIRFSEGLAELFAEEDTVFVEIGPGNALTTFTRNHKNRKTGHIILDLVRHPKEKASDDFFLLTQLGRLWLYGIKPGWQGFYLGKKRQRMPLPTYPFERQHFQVKGNVFAMAAEMASREFTSARRLDISDWFYVPCWKQRPLAANRENQAFASDTTHHSWLVFCDSKGLGTRLTRLLEREGQEVILVKKGSTFSQESENQYTINPQQPDHYLTLLTKLRTVKGKIPGKIVHLWGVTKEPGISRQDLEFEKTQHNGFFSLLYLAKAIGSENVNFDISPMQIDVVTDHMQAVAGERELYPEKATVLGLVKVIPQEYPGIRCRSIDIDQSLPGSPQEDKFLEQLLAECFTPPTEKVIAYRSNQRWVQEFQQFPLGEINPKTGTNIDVKAIATKLSLKEKGVYLITGGLGGIGLLVAKYLAQFLRSRLILTGRTVIPPQNQWTKWLDQHEPGDTVSAKIKKLQELEQSGAEVLAFKADAGNLQEMQEVITRAEQRFGSINGVIHAAGVTGGDSFSLISLLTKEQCLEQFRSKIHGLLVLEKLFRDKEPDFCLLTSSLAAVLGGLRFAAYSAANCFMDAYAAWCSRSQPNRWVSINWDGWNLGEARGNPTNKKSAVPGIRSAEGIDAFGRILNWQEPFQVIVSTRNLQNRLDQWVQLESQTREEDPALDGEETLTLLSRPALSSQFCPPRNQLEQTIANIWQNFFGFEVGIYDDFFELGGDSLKALTIIDKMNRQMNAQLSNIEMFSNSTIENLAECITKGNIQYEEAPYIPLNPDKPKKVFVFPPVLGDGIVYKDVTFPLKEYSFYAFNYIDDPDKIRRYLEMICELQPTGAYVLMGYSSGGSLAFEIAKELERQGNKVSDIILLDTYRINGFAQPSEEDRTNFQREIMGLLNQHGIRSETYKKKLLEKADKYYVYISCIENDGLVNANLHLVTGTDRKPEDYTEWENATTKNHITYQGFETHNQLLHTKVREKNAKLLGKILDSLEWQ